MGFCSIQHGALRYLDIPTNIIVKICSYRIAIAICVCVCVCVCVYYIQTLQN